MKNHKPHIQNTYPFSTRFEWQQFFKNTLEKPRDIEDQEVKSYLVNLSFEQIRNNDWNLWSFDNARYWLYLVWRFIDPLILGEGKPRTAPQIIKSLNTRKAEEVALLLFGRQTQYQEFLLSRKNSTIRNHSTITVTNEQIDQAYIILQELQNYNPSEEVTRKWSRKHFSKLVEFATNDFISVSKEFFSSALIPGYSEKRHSNLTILIEEQSRRECARFCVNPSEDTKSLTCLQSE